MNNPSPPRNSGSAEHPFPSVEVGGVPFLVAEPAEAVRWIAELATSRRRGVNVRFANAWNVALANDEADYMRVLRASGCVNFPDGTPVVWFMNRGGTGRARAHRLRGPSLFREVLHDSARVPLRHFLLGGSPETLSVLRQRITDQFPGARVAGAYSPPFAPPDDAFISACMTRIAEVDPDLVWIGLGTPKQDYVGTEIARLLKVPVLNVGAAFDFVAGTTKEAPQFIQRSGFEWLYRLLSEPRRLGRRYLYGNLRFLVAAVTRSSRRDARSAR